MIDDVVGQYPFNLLAVGSKPFAMRSYSAREVRKSWVTLAALWVVGNTGKPMTITSSTVLGQSSAPSTDLSIDPASTVHRRCSHFSTRHDLDEAMALGVYLPPANPL